METTSAARKVEDADPRAGVGERPLRILLAEDDEGFRRFVASILELDGHEVVQLADGQALLQYVSMALFDDVDVGPFDLVITDIRMPGWSGLEVLTCARAAGCLMPFIVITAFGDDEVHERAERLHAVAVLDKPFDMDELRDAVRRVGSSRCEDLACTRSLRALVAVDDPQLRAVTSVVLSGDGFDVQDMDGSGGLLDYLAMRSAADGVTDDFDIIISDVDVQGWRGLGVIGWLRSRGWHVPVILVSSDLTQRAGAREKGITAFLSRPFNVEDLRTVLLNISLWKLARMYSARQQA
jgi:CheY-like chemotaxis protein